MAAPTIVMITDPPSPNTSSTAATSAPVPAAVKHKRPSRRKRPAPMESQSPRGNSGFLKWKTAAFAFVFFASMTTVTYNSLQLKLSPAFMDQLTELESSTVFRDLQEKISETTESYFGGYQGEKQPSQPRRKSRHEDLRQLTRSGEAVECPSQLKPVEMISDAEADAGLGRLIPKIVHMTGKTRCLTDPFFEAVQMWQFANHSLYFHDDQAVEDLFNRDWPMFPQLKNSIACLQEAGGAAIADLWRYLALYEYGGIYTDMDNHPNKLFNATSVPNETDAYFLQEGGGFLSQYFFAVSPKHPLMFLAVHDVMQQMHSLADTGDFYVPVTSGPGSMKRAMLNFMGLNKTNIDDIAGKYSKPGRGHYEGVFGNHSVTVFSSRRDCNEYVIRTAVNGHRKMQGWRQMGITNYQAVNKESTGKTCFRVLHEHYSAQAEAQPDLLQQVYRRQRW